MLISTCFAFEYTGKSGEESNLADYYYGVAWMKISYTLKIFQYSIFKGKASQDEWIFEAQ